MERNISTPQIRSGGSAWVSQHLDACSTPGDFNFAGKNCFDLVLHSDSHSWIAATAYPLACGGGLCGFQGVKRGQTLPISGLVLRLSLDLGFHHVGLLDKPRHIWL